MPVGHCLGSTCTETESLVYLWVDNNFYDKEHKRGQSSMQKNVLRCPMCLLLPLHANTGDREVL